MRACFFFFFLFWFLLHPQHLGKFLMHRRYSIIFSFNKFVDRRLIIKHTQTIPWSEAEWRTVVSEKAVGILKHGICAKGPSSCSQHFAVFSRLWPLGRNLVRAVIICVHVESPLCEEGRLDHFWNMPAVNLAHLCRWLITRHLRLRTNSKTIWRGFSCVLAHKKQNN